MLEVWIYREPKTLGYECLVINPAELPTTNKESSDPVDSRKMAKSILEALLGGIQVPTLETEGDRQLFRYPKRLWTDLVREKNRIKDKLLQNGVEMLLKYTLLDKE
ncbi:hypothetical protein [Algoriphagus chordae]|uniref:Transposase n=1 Tax=Algoriphagus chordae TaxID=237019 RepID=A0A2W7S7F1_9BACT|nr:hypothetical protein [Algoriphagus chordae]PZX46492.1 hypothetical protein LV85_04212 [Algoriphagus chordae]